METPTLFQEHFRALSPEERLQSKKALLQSWNTQEDVWLFGYGSLMWNPGFEYEESHSGILTGYQRDFCVWSLLARGTVESPGLALGLKEGGECQGVVFRIKASQVESELQKVWDRERHTDVYLPIWASIQMEKETVQAISFVINTSSAQYAQGLSLPQKVHHILSAQGKYGSCLDYFLKTMSQLRIYEIQDPNLREIQTVLEARIQDMDTKQHSSISKF